LMCDPAADPRDLADLGDERTDVFLLGATLSELLTWRSPFAELSGLEMIQASTEGSLPAPSQQTLDGALPSPLEHIILKAMAPDPAQRYPSANALFEDVQAFLDGSRRRQFQQAEVQRMLREAQALKTQLKALDEGKKHAKMRVVREKKRIRPYDAPDIKKPLWEAEDKVRALGMERAVLSSQLEALLRAAISLEPTSRESRALLANHHWEEYVRAEAAEKTQAMIFHLQRVETFDDGQHSTRLRNLGWLSLSSQPEGGAVAISRYEERDRTLIPTPQGPPMRTPIHELELPAGRYELRLFLPGHLTTLYPVRIGRGETWRGSVRMLPNAAALEGFRYIPEGPFIQGGDSNAMDSRPARTVSLPGFLMARFPVTFGEYLVFINALESTDPDQVQARLPQNRAAGMLCRRAADGRWSPDYDALIHPSLRSLYPPDHGHEARMPVFGVRWADARAYARWLSDRLGRHLRLPSELEWEKAARGVDGRIYPWGDSFDPCFCKLAISRETAAAPEPEGAFPRDVSPYLINDMAGGMREWTSTALTPGHGDSPQAPEEVETDLRVVRGGSWFGTERISRCAYRFSLPADKRDVNVGFRLVEDLSQVGCTAR